MPDVNAQQRDTNPYNLTPPFVLPWAENILAADRQSALGISSRKSLAELERQSDTYDPSTRAGEYFMKMRILANGLAGKIEEERRILAAREEAARASRDGGFAKSARAKAQSGIRRTGIRLFLFGGFFTSLIYQILGVNFGQKSDQASQGPWETPVTALVVTTGLGMLGAYGLGFYEEFNSRRHNDKYDQEIQEAELEYQRAVREHSDNTLKAAALLWQECTGRPYDTERELQAQLLLPALRALMGNETLEADLEIATDQSLHEALNNAQKALKDVMMTAKPIAGRLLRRRTLRS
ncbi:hypothetical protein C2W62_02615 [Candidatus Entotheonella serta]|nr:hypothetical protein C2W62_02615 [Candidatus Entotheonella serta]